jgi:hypothetical protein
VLLPLLGVRRITAIGRLFYPPDKHGELKTELSPLLIYPKRKVELECFTEEFPLRLS